MSTKSPYGSQFPRFRPASYGFRINTEKSGDFSGSEKHFWLSVDLRHRPPSKELLPHAGHLPLLRLMGGKYLLDKRKLQELAYVACSYEATERQRVTNFE